MTDNHPQRRAPGTSGTSATLIDRLMRGNPSAADTVHYPRESERHQLGNSSPLDPAQTTSPGNSDTIASLPVY